MPVDEHPDVTVRAARPTPRAMNPRVLMDVGGWSDYQSLEPYLAKADPETIIGEFERAGLD